MARRGDAEILLSKVKADGTSIGNTALMNELGWGPEKYWRVRDKLLDDGILERGKGKGGSVWRIDRVKSKPTKKSSRVPESKLYEPLLEVLRGDWIREMRIEPDQIHFEITAKQGKKPTGGTWTRPDITAVSVRTFQHLSGKYLDVWTFEVKPIDGLDVTAVFEAASHGSRATRSYALLQVPAKSDQRVDELIERCAREAARLRVGLISFVSASKFDTWETKVEAPRLETAPESLDDFIGYLSEDGKKRIQTWK